MPQIIKERGQFITPDDEPVDYQQVLIEAASDDNCVCRVITLNSRQTHCKPASFGHSDATYLAGDLNSSRGQTDEGRPSYRGWCGGGWSEMHEFGPDTKRMIIRTGQVHCDCNYSAVGGQDNNSRLGLFGRIWVRDSDSLDDLPDDMEAFHNINLQEKRASKSAMKGRDMVKSVDSVASFDLHEDENGQSY